MPPTAPLEIPLTIPPVTGVPPMAIGIDAVARYVPETTPSMVNRPSSCVFALPPRPVNRPLRGSPISITHAPATGAPFSSTTTPLTRYAATDCIVKTMLPTSEPAATAIGCAAA